MGYEHLAWKETAKREAYSCRVFRVTDRDCVSPDGGRSTFTVIDAPDWAIVVPVMRDRGGDRFVMVRQWRPGIGGMSLEFPGGVVEPGEDPRSAAARELAEETGKRAEKLTELGRFNPNPAIMSNAVHVFLAEGISDAGEGHQLDDDEYVDVELVPVAEAVARAGEPPVVHALMASALALYLRLGGSGT